MTKPSLIYSIDRQVCDAAGEGNPLLYAISEAADLLRMNEPLPLEDGQLVVITVGVMTAEAFDALTAPVVSTQ